MNLKKGLLILLLAVIIIVGVVIAINAKSDNKKDSEKIQIVATNFVSYDFLKAIVGDVKGVELTFLLGPGKDAHGYDPTAQDLVKIQNADLFVYIGGNLESWADKVIKSIDTNNTKVICVADDIQKSEKKDVDGAEAHEHSHDDETDEHGEEAHDHETDEHGEEAHDHEHEGDSCDTGSFDEHIWTSPANAIKMVNTLAKEMVIIDKANGEKYAKNSENYINKIKEVDSEIQNVVDNKVRNRLIFGDKMPMQYFIDYYKLEVSAAFSGCGSETEPSAKTITYLVNKVKEEKVPVVLYIEMSEGKVSKTIAEEAGNGVKAVQIQSMHNISKADFDKGATWVSLMRENLAVLKQALQ